MIGLDEPGPGSGVFHFRLLDSVQVTGTFVSGLIPDPSGPRSRGQSAPAYGLPAKRQSRMSICLVVFVVILLTSFYGEHLVAGFANDFGTTDDAVFVEVEFCCVIHKIHGCLGPSSA